MEKRILGVIRVSTDRQETQSQKDSLLPFIKSKGFKEEEIEWLEAKGASAHQANDAYLKFVQDIKDLTSGDSTIKTIVCWHLNRLGRQKEWLAHIEKYLKENKIQLWVQNCFGIPFLDDKGEETFAASIMFSVYSAMIEAETEELFEKTKRGKERNKREGKWNGGKIKLGYSVGEGNKIVVDDETSNIVRNIFRLYTEEDWSCKQIYDHYNGLGVFASHKFKNQGYKCVASILKDLRYSRGEEPLYKPFIPVEVQDKAIEMISKFKDRQRKSGNVYFCKGLLKDKGSGACLGASKGTLVYTSLVIGHTYNVSINVLDYITWKEARNIYMFKFEADKLNDLSYYENAIIENETKIETLKVTIDELIKEIERGNELYVQNPKYYSKAKLEKVTADNEKAIGLIEKDINQMLEDNFRMKSAIEENVGSGTNMTIKSIDDEFFTKMNDEQKKAVIDSVIKEVEIERIEEKHYIIKIKQVIDITRTSTWEYHNTGHKIHLKEWIAPEKFIDHTKLIAKAENKRFIREDYWRRYYTPKKDREQ